MDSILTIKEICEKLQLSRVTVLKLRKQGMPSMKVNRSVRFDENEVMEWLKNRKV